MWIGVIRVTRMIDGNSYDVIIKYVRGLRVQYDNLPWWTKVYKYHWIAKLMGFLGYVLGYLLV